MCLARPHAATGQETFRQGTHDAAIFNDLLAELLEGKPLDLHTALRKPLFVPPTLRALRLLEIFRESGIHLAVVIDEYGGVEGLVTLNDVLEELTGSLAWNADPRVVQREDGSRLVDASLTMDEFRDAIGLEERRGEERRDYNTVAGLVVTTSAAFRRVGATSRRSGAF